MKNYLKRNRFTPSHSTFETISTKGDLFFCFHKKNPYKPHAITILEKLMGASLKHLSFNFLSIVKATHLFHIYMISVRGLKGVFVSVLSRWIALGLVRPPKSRPGHKSAKEEDETIDTESIKCIEKSFCFVHSLRRKERTNLRRLEIVSTKECTQPE